MQQRPSAVIPHHHARDPDPPPTSGSHGRNRRAPGRAKDLAKKLVLVFSQSQLTCAQASAWASQSKWVLPWSSGKEGSAQSPS